MPLLPYRPNGPLRSHIRIVSFGESSFEVVFLPFSSRKEPDMQNPVGKIFAYEGHHGPFSRYAP